MRSRKSLSLFQGYGIELEYMIVDKDSLSVLPLADHILKEIAGKYVDEVATGKLAWSNELALHLIELKTNGPVPSLHGVELDFQSDVCRINHLLAGANATLLPTAMHPLMNPATETRIWPHHYRSVYESYHRIFNCYSHGWANVQSVHLNLPFRGDGEFAKLHAAVRLALPILPALAASSPIRDGQVTDFLDARLDVYRSNQSRIPSITGPVIPEPVYTRSDYDTQILQKIYRDVSPHDPKGILQHEWLNSRAAVARFRRNTIEIRILDMQEFPHADIAIAIAVASLLHCLVEEHFAPGSEQQQFPTETLRDILFDVIRQADQTVIRNQSYLRLFGVSEIAMTAGALWKHLIAHARRCRPEIEPYLPIINTILAEGCLARRILRRLAASSSPRHMIQVYRELADCLQTGHLFAG